MNTITILMIAIGLAMDAFAVSISSGAVVKRLHVRHALLIAGFFGAFQAIMPVIGWGVASFISDLVRMFGPWVAFALLMFVGLKMLYESHFLDGEVERKDPLSLRVLFVMALATSIDALAVGISISAMHVDVLLPITIIGSVTFFFSFIGAYIGKVFGHIFENKIEIIGALILIGMGFKILAEHMIH